MLKGNRRDTKFLIFQSLYIIAISILFYKGTDLSLKKVVDIRENEVVVSKALLEKIDTTLQRYDPVKDTLIQKPDPDEKIKMVMQKDTIITKEMLAEKERQILELRRNQPAVRTPTTTTNRRTESHDATIEGETPK